MSDYIPCDETCAVPDLAAALAAAQERLAEVERELETSKALLAAALRRVDITVTEKLQKENDALRARCAGMQEALEAAFELYSLGQSSGAAYDCGDMVECNRAHAPAEKIKEAMQAALTAQERG